MAGDTIDREAVASLARTLDRLSSEFTATERRLLVALGLAAAEAGIASEKLPRVDVADGDQLRQPTLSVEPAQVRDRGRADGGAPLAVERPPTIGYLMQPRNALLLGQHLEHTISGALVMLDQHAHGPSSVSDTARPRRR
jgi:hypothetical protein